jgi:hypothetical protein
MPVSESRFGVLPATPRPSEACRFTPFPNALRRPIRPPPGVVGVCGTVVSPGLGVPQLEKSSGEGGTAGAEVDTDGRRALEVK